MDDELDFEIEDTYDETIDDFDQGDIADLADDAADSGDYFEEGGGSDIGDIMDDTDINDTGFEHVDVSGGITPDMMNDVSDVDDYQDITDEAAYEQLEATQPEVNDIMDEDNSMYDIDDEEIEETETPAQPDVKDIMDDEALHITPDIAEEAVSEINDAETLEQFKDGLESGQIVVDTDEQEQDADINDIMDDNDALHIAPDIVEEAVIEINKTETLEQFKDGLESGQIVVDADEQEQDADINDIMDDNDDALHITPDIAEEAVSEINDAETLEQFKDGLESGQIVVDDDKDEIPEQNEYYEEQIDRDPVWHNEVGTIEKEETQEASGDSQEVPDIEDIHEWLGDINPNYDPFDMSSVYNNNCGSCAYAVEQHLNGNTDIYASINNIGTPKEMNELTGLEQVAMSPEEIQDYLVSQGAGSHGIVGIDRDEGPGHWFNAYYDGEKVVAIDGQTGEIRDWPPDYGDVINWDLSVRKEMQ